MPDVTGPRLAADVLAGTRWREGTDPDGRPCDLPASSDAQIDALLAGADMVALVRTDAGVEVRGLEPQGGHTTDGGVHILDDDAYRLVDAPVPEDEEDDRG